MIKIFHTGDLHLDSAFHKLSYGDRIAARAHQRDIFSKMIRYVRENGFDMLLISGDLFDSPIISPETEECVINAFSSLNCPVIIAPGNHDPFATTSIYSRKDLPENVYIFNSREMQLLSFNDLGVQVCGYAFMSDTYAQNPLDEFSIPEYDGATVLCAHAELNSSVPRYAPVFDSDIFAMGFTYAALGHLHKSTEIIRKDKSAIAYCGFPESRGFDEEGFGGALLVTIDADRVLSIERVTFGEKRHVIDSLDISGINSTSELIEALDRYIVSKGFAKETALRLILEGMAQQGLNINTASLEDHFASKLMLIEVVDKTVPYIDHASLASDVTLRGEIYRTLLPMLNSESKDQRRIASEALKTALIAIEGRSVT